MASRFMDDVVMMAQGADFERANRRLESMMEKEGGALNWVKQANCVFEIDKFALVDVGERAGTDVSVVG